MTGLACGQDGIKKNHMDILWHEYGARDGNVPIREAGLQARASIVGRLGMMMLACGTGACAVAVACVLNGRTGRRVLVHLRGGDLEIEWDERADTVWMTGPAAFVCDCECNPKEFGQ